MKLQLSLCAKELPDDAESGNKYYVTIYNEASTATLGKTQPTGPGISPTWNEVVTVDGDKEKVVNVVVYNAKGDSIVASTSFHLDEVMASKQSAVAKLIKEGSTGAPSSTKICIHVQEEQTAPQQLHLVLGAKGLPDTDLGFTFKKQLTDPFYELYNARDGSKIARSNVCHDTLDPVWKAAVLDLNTVFQHTANEELNLDEAQFKITLYDKDKGEAKEYLGQVELSVNQMLRASGGQMTFPLVFNRGSVVVQEAKLVSHKASVTRLARKNMNAAAAALDMDLGALEQAQKHADDRKADCETKRAAMQRAMDAAAALVKEEEQASEQQGKAQDSVSTLAEKAKVFVALQSSGTLGTGRFQMQLRAENLPDTDFGIRNKTDAVYLVFSAQDGLEKVHRSNIVNDDLNPTWDLSKVDLVKLCNGDLDATFRIAVYDKDGGDDADYLGILNVSVNQLLKASGTKQEFKLEKAKRGSVFVVSAEVLGHVVVADRLKSLEEELTLAKKTLDDAKAAWKIINAQVEQARETAYQAQEAAEAAQDEADAALLAVEMAKASLKG